MKKLLLLIALIPTFASTRGWPPALTIPIAVPLLFNNDALSEAMADGLQFEHSRGIHYRMEMAGSKVDLEDPEFDVEDVSHPFVIDYHLRWGYKGAGNPHHPFRGLQARLQVELSYEGISFHLCRSRTLRKKLYASLKPFLNVTPCQEFYLKLLQLAWTTSQQDDIDYAQVQHSLEVLFARLKLTEHGTHCRLYGMPVLNNSKRPGLELFLHQAPTVFTKRFVMMSQKIGSVFGLIAKPKSDTEKETYLRALLAQVDYFQEEPYHLLLPRGGTITLPFSTQGSGLPHEPFTGTTLTFEVPQTRTMTAGAPTDLEGITRWDIELTPEQECLARIVLLVLHNRRTPMRSHHFTEELSTLLARLGITPPSSKRNDTVLRSVLGLLCQYHQQIARYDFSQPLERKLSSGELLLQLARVGYKAYTLNSDRLFLDSSTLTPQVIADFVTEQVADALRCYRGTIALRNASEPYLTVPQLRKHGITINSGLFFRTLLAPSPGVKPYSFDTHSITLDH